MECFKKYKEETMKSLEKAKKEGKVDKPAYPFIDLINSKEHYFTTSSCSGRILLLIGGETKKDSSFYKRWHRTITTEELREAISNYRGGKPLWFRVQPFIFHVVSDTIENAFRFIKMARSLGVKRIGAQEISCGYLIEMYGTESLAVPINICNCDLEKLVEFANKKMEANQKRLNKLVEGLKDL